MSTNHLLESKIRGVVEDIGDPLMRHFMEHIDSDPDEIRACVKRLVQDQVLRMKEDSVDHEYAYIKGSRWDALRGGKGEG